VTAVTALEHAAGYSSVLIRVPHTQFPKAAVGFALLHAVPQPLKGCCLLCPFARLHALSVFLNLVCCFAVWQPHTCSPGLSCAVVVGRSTRAVVNSARVAFCELEGHCRLGDHATSLPMRNTGSAAVLGERCRTARFLPTTTFRIHSKTCDVASINLKLRL